MKIIRYVQGVPSNVLPKGAVLVHNFAPRDEEQARNTALDGFRVWVAQLEEGDVQTPCDCGWAGVEHFTTYRPAPD